MTLRTTRTFLVGTLRGRLILGVAFVHAVMMTLFIVDLTLRQGKMVRDRQIEETTELAKSLSLSAAVWIASDDISGLQELIKSIQQYPNVQFAVLMDENGFILAHSDTTKQGLYYLHLPKQIQQAELIETNEQVRIIAPTQLGSQHIGWVCVGTSCKSSKEKITDMVVKGALYAFIAILIGSLIAWWIGSLFTRRLYAIQQTMNEVKSGNWLVRSKVTGTDETASMATEFNNLLDTLDEQRISLIKSETKYQQLLWSIRVGVIVHGVDTKIKMSNTMAQKTLGLSNEQLMGMTSMDAAWHFLKEDGTTMPLEDYPVNKTLATLRPIKELIIGVTLPNSESISWVLVSTEITFDEQNNPDEVIVTFVDISKRKQAQEALKQQNRKLRAISACNQLLIRAENEETLLNEVCKIICNEAGYRLAWVGYAEQDAAKTIRPVVWAGFDSGYIENAKLSWSEETEHGRGPGGKAIRSGHFVYIEDVSTDPTMSLWREDALKHGYKSLIALPLKDENENAFGMLLIYSSDVNAISSEEIQLLEELSGDLAFGITVLRNRKERQYAEEALIQTESRLNEAQHIAHVGSWDLDVKNDLLTWSDEIFRIFEIDPSIFGASYEAFLDAIHPDDRDLVNDAYTNALKTRMPYSVDHRLLFKDGRIKYLREQCETFYDAEGKPYRSLGVVQDITKQKQTEQEIQKLNQELEKRVFERTAQLEAANKELEAFAYSVSHDLRSPLRGIDGFSQVLLEEYQDSIDENGKNYLHRIRMGAQRMAQLIDDMLHLSQVNRSELNIKQVDISGIVEAICEDLRQNEPNRNVEFCIQKGVQVQGDERLLRIVFDNLIGNAWKFTSNHSTARIEFGCIPDNEPPLFFVRDDGAGFNMNYSKKLFGAFQRLHNTTEFPGTGIGLATVQRIIHRHGGSIWAEGEVEKGATIYFTIP